MSNENSPLNPTNVEKLHKIISEQYALTSGKEQVYQRLISDLVLEIDSLKMLVRHLEKVSNSRVDPEQQKVGE